MKKNFGGIFVSNVLGEQTYLHWLGVFFDGKIIFTVYSQNLELTMEAN